MTAHRTYRVRKNSCSQCLEWVSCSTAHGHGTTVFMSTHSLEVAEEVCDEIAIIQSGRIIAQGTGEELKNQAEVDGSMEEVFLKLVDEKGLVHERSLSSF